MRGVSGSGGGECVEVVGRICGMGWHWEDGKGMLHFCLSNGDGGAGRKVTIFGWGGARRVCGFSGSEGGGCFWCV